MLQASDACMESTTTPRGVTIVVTCTSVCAGSVHVGDASSITFEGGTTFANNGAGYDGGERHITISVSGGTAVATYTGRRTRAIFDPILRPRCGAIIRKHRGEFR